MTNLPIIAETPSAARPGALHRASGRLVRVSAWKGCAWPADRDKHDTRKNEPVIRTERCLLQCVRSDSEPDCDIYSQGRLMKHDDAAIKP